MSIHSTIFFKMWSLTHDPDTGFVTHLYSYATRPVSSTSLNGSRILVLFCGLVPANFPYSPRLPWRRHQMDTFSASLTICPGNSPVPGEFPAQRPVTRSFGVSFDLRLNKRLRKQWWGWWFETLSRPLWRHWQYDSYHSASGATMKITINNWIYLSNVV